MTVIDFQSLLKAERKKPRCSSRKNQREAATTTIIPLEDGTDPVSSSNGQETDGRGKHGAASPTAAVEHVPSCSFLIPAASFVTRFDPTTHLVCRDPSSIYYVPNFLLTTCQPQLVDWLLHCLPENPIESCSNPHQANGKWTPLKYAARRVALFDAKIQAPFPKPLELLVEHLSRTILRKLPGNQDDDKKEEEEEDTNTTDSSRMRRRINHILINDYATSQVGILPHTDGPAYEPYTVTLSLNSPAVFQFTQPRNNHVRRNEEENNDEEDKNWNSDERTPSSTLGKPQNDSLYGSSSSPSSKTPIHQLWLEPGSLVVFCNEAYSDWLHSIPTRTEFSSANRSMANDKQQGTNYFLNDHLLENNNYNSNKSSMTDIPPEPLQRRISLTFRIAK